MASKKLQANLEPSWCPPWCQGLFPGAVAESMGALPGWRKPTVPTGGSLGWRKTRGPAQPCRVLGPGSKALHPVISLHLCFSSWNSFPHFCFSKHQSVWEPPEGLLTWGARLPHHHHPPPPPSASIPHFGHIHHTTETPLGHHRGLEVHDLQYH